MLNVQGPLQEIGVLATRTPRQKATSRRRPERGKDNGETTPKLLIVGSIRELGLYRAEYLQNKGFLVQVCAPPSADEIVASLRPGSFHGVILSYTLPNELVLEVSELVRQHCPQCALIVISDHARPDPRIMPDEVVVADHGPEALLSAVRRALQVQ